MTNRGRHRKKSKKNDEYLKNLSEWLKMQRLFDYRTIKDVIQTYVK